jgi:tetratricopeptide (TPR) repeat protein
VRFAIERRTVVLASVLFLLVLSAYAPALTGGFIWDDDAHISENATLHDLTGLRQIWFNPGANMQYYPLTFTSFWIAHRLWGLNPLGYHLLNAAMHALASILLWRLLARLRVPGAFAGACLFALHPVNVMSVAWATELKNTLSASLALASCLAYVRFAGLGTPDAAPPADRRRWYAASFGLFALALLAKTAVGFLPLTLFLIVWWKKDGAGWRDAWPLAPFAALVAGMGAMTIVVEHLHGGDAGHAFAMSFPERLIVSGRSFWFYLGKLVFPHPLTFLYERWTIDAHDALQYLPAAAAIAVFAALFAFRGRIGKGPFVAFAHFYVATSAALIFFVVTYFTRFSFVSDHWQYFGMASLAALVGAGLEGGKIRRGAAIALITVCWILAWRRATVYQDVEILWRDAIAKSPGAWMAHNNLGVVLMRRGATQEAIAEYTEALRLKPDLIETHLNLGNILAGAGRIDSAVPHYDEALRLDPSSAEAHFDLGRVLAGQGKNAEAMEQYQEALRLQPVYAEADNSVGVALGRAGNRSEAIAHFENALRAKPDYVDAHINLGNVLAADGKLEPAIEHYSRALRVRPDHAAAHAGLGRALSLESRTVEAIAQYEEALRLEPELAGAANSLGMELASLDRWPEAIERFRQALRTRPDFAEAHNNLGIALVQANQVPEAIEQFQRALQIKPDFSDARANLEKARAAR